MPLLGAPSLSMIDESSCRLLLRLLLLVLSELFQACLSWESSSHTTDKAAGPQMEFADRGLNALPSALWSGVRLSEASDMDFWPGGDTFCLAMAGGT